MSKAPLKQWFELQDLHRIVSVVLVASLNNGSTLLCILNQVIPMPIFLQREARKLHPKKTLMCLGTNNKNLVNRFPRIHYLSDKAERKNKMKYRMIKHPATKQHSAPPLRKNFYHFASYSSHVGELAVMQFCLLSVAFCSYLNFS